MPAFRLPGPRATWVFAGDSITQGVGFTHGERCWVEHVHERVRWQLHRLDDAVVNSGVAGWRVGDLIADHDRFVARYQPDVVSIAFGANDATAGAAGLGRYRDGLTALVARTRDLGAEVVVHTPTPVTAAATATGIADYAQVAREVAAAGGATLVDHATHWTEHFDGREPIAWLDDHTHPNGAGHLQMANLTLRTLGLGELTRPL